MNYTTPGKRILAAIIDFFAISLLSAFAFAFGDLIGVFVGGFFVEAAYMVLMMGSPWHATLGQKALNMQVVDEYGNGIDYGKATVRYFGSLVSAILIGIGFLVGLFDERYQTLHDKMAGTYVVDASPLAYSAGGSGGGAVIGVSGEKAGMKFALSGNGVMIGRESAACHIVMKKSAGVSRIHCFVSYNPASRMYIISDRGSKYGTFTERGERITPQKSVALKSGERFYLGSPNNMFEVM
ncbi:MAG: RDD family protein [Clostridia bacterium]|nr:RDD family protein [Clostridia bacterium]